MMIMSKKQDNGNSGLVVEVIKILTDNDKGFKEIHTKINNLKVKFIPEERIIEYPGVYSSGGMYVGINPITEKFDSPYIHQNQVRFKLNVDSEKDIANIYDIKKSQHKKVNLTN